MSPFRRQTSTLRRHRSLHQQLASATTRCPKFRERREPEPWVKFRRPGLGTLSLGARSQERQSRPRGRVKSDRCQTGPRAAGERDLGRRVWAREGAGGHALSSGRSLPAPRRPSSALPASRPSLRLKTCGARRGSRGLPERSGQAGVQIRSARKGWGSLGRPRVRREPELGAGGARAPARAAVTPSSPRAPALPPPHPPLTIDVPQGQLVAKLRERLHGLQIAQLAALVHRSAPRRGLPAVPLREMRGQCRRHHP